MTLGNGNTQLPWLTRLWSPFAEPKSICICYTLRSHVYSAMTKHEKQQKLTQHRGGGSLVFLKPSGFAWQPKSPLLTHAFFSSGMFDQANRKHTQHFWHPVSCYFKHSFNKLQKLLLLEAWKYTISLKNAGTWKDLWWPITAWGGL